MCPVLPSPSHSSDADFAHIISRKFPHGRFLIVGVSSQEVERQFAEAKREALVVRSPGDLTTKLGQGGAAARFETAVWFYPSGENDDERMVGALSHCAANIVLTPGPGADVARRRLQLVRCFGRFGFLPDYECDLIELDPGAVCIRHQPSEAAALLTPAVETAFARLNKALSDLKRSLRIRGSELEWAHRHIAALEEKLLKLKAYRRELKLLKEQKQTLRKSPERRVGQVLLAPYRLPEKLVKTVWKKLHRATGERRRSIPSSEYQKWFERHRATAHDLERMRNESHAFTSRSLISVITPVFDTPVQRLEEAIESVLTQAYENWELLLIDDGSSDTDLLHALPVLAARDRRIILKSLGKHEGISAASNQALALARGEWVTFLDHDDVLEPDALFQIAKLLQAHPEADLIYSDEDKLSDDGFEAPLFKPDWSPDFFLSYNYLGHLTAVRHDIVQKAGGFRSQFDSAQDYDLFFRVIEQTKRIYHIPRVLYHWRRSETSSAISVRQKPEQLEASRLAVEDYLKRRGESAHVAVDWRTHTFCVRRELLEPKKISVIVSTRHGLGLLEQCIESLTSKTNYPSYEIVIVHDDTFHDTSTFSSRFRHRLLHFSGAANDSAVKNFAIKQTDDPWILFLDESIEAIEPDWLTIMAEHVQRPEVGAVSARLLNPNGTVEQAGMVVGVDKTAQPAFHGFPAEDPGANRQLLVTRNCSAVSSACMLTRREVFQQTGGFDESLAGALADVDLGLKMQRAGYLIVYTPFAKVYWHEASSDGIDVKSEAIMRERWAEVLRSDPYYNPNLSREQADFSLGK
jgi:glycosyltransferase involved in cell wall biosynthesis